MYTKITKVIHIITLMCNLIVEAENLESHRVNHQVLKILKSFQSIFVCW